MYAALRRLERRTSALLGYRHRVHNIRIFCHVPNRQGKKLALTAY
jgi:hypothetical protein